MLSGGITSWAVGRRLVDQYGCDAVTLLFADTLIEDEDLYRFNADVERDLGLPVTVVCDGRTPEQVDADRRWLSNSRVAQCSLELKIKPCKAWLEANCDPADTTLYYGIDWSELHRLPAIEALWLPWKVDAPLTRPPYADKRDLIIEVRKRGITEPRMYALGFPHNNCGGRCIRGGQDHFRHLLRVFPDRFAAVEAHEQRMRTFLGADVSIVTRTVNKVKRQYPLAELRADAEANPNEPMSDGLDWGGCGCMVDAGGAA